MKSVLAGCVASLAISMPVLADGPRGPAQPDWPPPGGYAGSATNPMQPAQAYPSATNGYSRAYAPAHNFRAPSHQREAPVLPPSPDWPDAAYGYADVAPPPRPGYPVQVIPPPSIPLEGDVMETTSHPVRHWRPPIPSHSILLEGDIMDTTPYPVRHWRPPGR